MKRYLLFIAVISFCITTGVYAGLNDPNDPNDFAEPNIPKAVNKVLIPVAVDANSNKNYPTIDNAIKFLTPNTGTNDPNESNEPNEPNEVDEPAPVADVAVPIANKLPGIVSVDVFPAVELPEFKYRLLPLDAERTDGDAAQFYVKAIDALPAGFSQSTINGLLNAPMDKFNADSAAAIVNPCAKSLDLVRQGGLSRKCQWSKQTADKKAFSLLEGLNSLTSLVALKARLDTSTGEYKTAVQTISDGLAMSRHIANTPSTVQDMAAVNTASVMLKNVEEIVKSQSAPSLYRSLSDLPKPLISLNMPPVKVQSRQEEGVFGRDGAWHEPMGGYSEDEPAEPVEDSPYSSNDMVLQMNKLDRLVAALQCLEGIRYYAAIHGGKLPASLNDISDLSLPLDPVTQRPFRYQLGTGKALLGSPVTDKQADRESTIYFEILIKKQ